MKRISISCFILFFSSTLIAQRVICPSTLREYRNNGLWAVEAFGGAKYWTGWVGGVGVNYFIPSLRGVKTKYEFPKQFIKANIFYAYDKGYGIEHTARGLDLLFGYTPFNVGDLIYGTVLIGGTLSNDRLESTTNGNLPTTDVKQLNVYKPGGVYGFEASSFLGRTSNVSVVVSFTQRTYGDVFWGNYRWYATIGLRWHLIQMRPLSEVKKD